MEVSNPIPARRRQVASGTMKATLIYNANARSTDTHTVDDLQEGLLAAGYEPVYTPTEAEDDLKKRCATPTAAWSSRPAAMARSVPWRCG
jgi:hypothetical protein